MLQFSNALIVFHLIFDFNNCYLFLMPCPHRKCKKRQQCQNTHNFSLKSLNLNAHYRDSIKLNICPTIDRNGNVIAQTFPVFNTDKKAYTPAFCLDIDRNYSFEQDQQMLTDHLRKIKDCLQNKLELLFPKPNYKNRYCSVCKENYQDYLSHISGQEHKKCIHKSKFNKYIFEICEKFKCSSPKKELDQKEQANEKFDKYQNSATKKMFRLDPLFQFSEQKTGPQSSNTNLGNLHIQNAYTYNNFYGSVGIPQILPSSYYMSSLPGYYPMQMPWYTPEIMYPNNRIVLNQIGFNVNCFSFPTPMVISDNQ